MIGKGALVVLISSLALLSGVQSRHLLQGTNNTSTAVVRWLVPANGVIDAVRVPLGGNVTFSWTQLHDVWEIPSAQCPSAFANSSSIRRIAPQSNGGSVTVNFNETKVRYFACSVSTHCQEGQLVAVRVNGAEAPGPARAPGPSRTSGSAGYSGNSSPGYSGGSSGNYGSSSNSTSSGYSGNSSPGYGGGSSSNYGSTSNSTSSGYGSDGVNRTPGYSGGSSDSYGVGK